MHGTFGAPSTITDIASSTRELAGMHHDRVGSGGGYGTVMTTFARACSVSR